MTVRSFVFVVVAIMVTVVDEASSQKDSLLLTTTTPSDVHAGRRLLCGGVTDMRGGSSCITCNTPRHVIVGARPQADGTLLDVDDEGVKTMYSAGSWWTDDDSQTYYVCVLTRHKCCLRGQAVDIVNGSCVDDVIERPPLVDDGAVSSLCVHGMKRLRDPSVISNFESDAVCIDWLVGDDEDITYSYFRCLPCDPRLTETLSDVTIENLTSSLTTSDGAVIPAKLWWHDDVDDVVRVCMCNLNTCLSKCCDMDMRINASDGKCVNMTSSSMLTDSDVDVEARRYRHFRLVANDPCTTGKYLLTPDVNPLDEYVLESDGHLLLPNVSVNISSDQFCIDWDVTNGSVVLFPCFPDELVDVDTMYTLYPVGMIMSEVFLLVTMIVYVSIAELRNIHGLSLISYVTCLFVGYLLLGLVQLGRDDVGDCVCVWSAFIIYFSFLASFFWLNVMCLDIWWTFSGFRPLRGSIKEREHKKFILYSVYCWGCPLLMLILAMVMDLHPEVPDSYLKPGFGNNRCWFDDDMANLAYFLGPIAALILINMLMFACTAFKIKELKRETKILKRQESKRFYLYVRLFLVMGVNWAAEVVSWACGGPAYLWYVTDVTNTLQGVLIFFIFVWKQRIRRLVWERLCGSHGGSDGNGTPGLTNTQTTSTRFSIRRSTRRSTHANRQVSKYRMAPLMGGEGNKQELVSDTP